MFITRVGLFLLGIALIVWIMPTLKAQWKGRKGEKLVRRKLAHEGATALHDIIIPKGKGDKLAQVDHVVLTQSEIVILETKDWNGTFTDPGSGKSWVQKMGYKYPRTYYRHSPVEQNKGHHYAISRIIGSPWKLTDLVVMAGNCRFPAGIPDHVVLLQDMIPELRKRGLDATRASPQLVADWDKLKQSQRKSAKDRKRQMQQVTRSPLQFFREYYSQVILESGVVLILLGFFM